MATRATTTNGRREYVRLMKPGEGRRAFDRAARYWLRMSGAEFLRRWDAGEYPDPDSDPKVMHVAMLLPLGR